MADLQSADTPRNPCEKQGKRPQLAVPLAPRASALSGNTATAAAQTRYLAEELELTLSELQAALGSADGAPAALLRAAAHDLRHAIDLLGRRVEELAAAERHRRRLKA